MSMHELTNAQLVADIRKRLDQGYAAATAERVKSIASRTSDPELLRELVDALTDAMISNKPRKASRPKKSAVLSQDGVINLADMAPMTAREKMASIKQMVREWGICEKIHTAHTKHGANIKEQCQRHKIGTSTYYKWFPAGP